MEFRAEDSKGDEHCRDNLALSYNDHTLGGCLEGDSARFVGLLGDVQAGDVPVNFEVVQSIVDHVKLVDDALGFDDASFTEVV